MGLPLPRELTLGFESPASSIRTEISETTATLILLHSLLAALVAPLVDSEADRPSQLLTVLGLAALVPQRLEESREAPVSICLPLLSLKRGQSSLLLRL